MVFEKRINQIVRVVVKIASHCKIEKSIIIKQRGLSYNVDVYNEEDVYNVEILGDGIH